MSIHKKIKNDDFVNLDYQRIKSEVQDNLNIDVKHKTNYFKKFVKMSIVSIAAIFVCILSINFISDKTRFIDDKQYLQLSASEQVKLNYTENRDEGYIQFLNKLNIFSATLNESVYKEFYKEKNYVISPISIYMALAMAMESGNEKTKNEILTALDMNYDEVKKYTKILFSQLNYQKSNEGLVGDVVTTEQKMTNSIWIDDNVTLKTEGLQNLSTDYNCSSYSAPFQNDNKKAVKAVRKYIYDNTNGLIDPDLRISDETLFVIMNTYFLHDLWDYLANDLQFTAEEYLFNNLIKTKLLKGYYNLGQIYETQQYSHFYTETKDNFKIKFIVPKDGYTINDIFTTQTIEEVNSINDYQPYDHENKLEHHTRCLFPEFNAQFNEDIKSVLIQDFGVKNIFTLSKSLTNLTDEEVICTSLQHITSLNVNKKGIYGAAVTLLPSAGAAGPMYEEVYHDFIIDKEFIVIVSNDNDVMLFSGVISKI